ncbi:gallerimycin-like [Anticarsia gemmatalis]|uniref:gallerimycin-like n=1 Tax=Anticarsia gemmatalis TaxID=129554 RepID=UPI003F775267
MECTVPEVANMKACFVFALFIIVFAVVTSAAEIRNEDSSQTVMRRTVRDLPGHGCIFYQCIASCKQRGYKNGGYCTINGCQCLR